MNAVRVPWSSASFLAYLGGFTILFAIVGLLAIASDEHSSGGLVFWEDRVAPLEGYPEFLPRHLLGSPPPAPGRATPRRERHVRDRRAA